MKKKNFLISSLLALSCFGLLFSCNSNNNNNNNNNDPTGDNDQQDDDTNQEETKEEIIHGDFDIVDKTYTSKKYNSLILFKDEFSSGTIKTAMKIGDQYTNNGLIFGYKSENEIESYVLVGFNTNKEFIVSNVINGTTSEVFKQAVDDVYLNTLVDISLIYYKEYKTFEIFYNNSFLGSATLTNDLSTNKIGYLAGAKNTSFKVKELTNGYDSTLVDPEAYHGIAGAFANTEDNKGLYSIFNNSLQIVNEREFTTGTYSADVRICETGYDNGIVFGLSDDGSDSYWEKDGVSYYFYFVSLSGLAYLGKTTNNYWTVCATRQIESYTEDTTYNLKVVKTEEDIYCYVDNKLYFVYSDASPLSGTKFGLRAGGSDVVYSNMVVTNYYNHDASNPIDYDVASGSFKEFDNLLTSTSNNSLIVSKKEVSENGTIECDFAPISNKDTGVVFRLSKPNSETYFEDEEGLSYYWFYFTSTGGISFAKYVNGEVTKEISKFLPYGSYISNSYRVKIVMDGSDIYAYFGPRLSFYYHDDNALTGKYYGFKTIGKGSMFSNVIFNSEHTKETAKYLIFGHSYTEYWYTYKEDFACYTDIKDIGIGASTCQHWANQYVNEVIAYEPEYGIYWNGINDIGSGYSAQQIMDAVEKTLDTIKKGLPNFKVALVGVCRCPNYSTRRNDISAVNNLYKEYASSRSWVHYIDTELMYCDSNGKEIASYFTDGLHPSHAGYLLAAEAIINSLK